MAHINRHESPYFHCNLYMTPQETILQLDSFSPAALRKKGKMTLENGSRNLFCTGTSQFTLTIVCPSDQIQLTSCRPGDSSAPLSTQSVAKRCSGTSYTSCLHVITAQQKHYLCSRTVSSNLKAFSIVALVSFWKFPKAEL